MSKLSLISLVNILIEIDPTSNKSTSIVEIVGLDIDACFVPTTPNVSKSSGTLKPKSIAALLIAQAKESRDVT